MTTALRFECSNCGRTATVHGNAAGKRVRCTCGVISIANLVFTRPDKNVEVTTLATTSVMRCASCGAAVSINDSICAHCGQPIWISDDVTKSLALLSAYLKSNQFAEARELASGILKGCPACALAWAALGIASVRLGAGVPTVHEIDGAVKCFDKAHRISPNDNQIATLRHDAAGFVFDLNRRFADTFFGQLNLGFVQNEPVFASFVASAQAAISLNPLYSAQIKMLVREVNAIREVAYGSGFTDEELTID